MQCPSCNHGFEPSAGSDIPDRCPSCGALMLEKFCELQRVGGGGMGDVYRAREPEMGNRTVAIKIPRSQANIEPMQERFEREIMASGRLQHENAVRVYRRGQERGRPYLVMEFVCGEKLSDVIRREHPLAPRRVARILLGITRGLEHGAAQGIVNRDIKPENIFLTAPEETPKILDYGLALIADKIEQVTRFGAILGTPSYIAPEQLRDPHGVTVAADVYSLGCTAYCCLTGKRPFEPRTVNEIWHAHAESPRPHVSALRPDVPHAFDELVQKMMASEERDRPTPQQVITALQAMMPELDEQRPSLPGTDDTARIATSCPACGEEFNLTAAMAGKRIQCTNKLCKTVFSVPSPDEPGGPAPEARGSLRGGTTEILQGVAAGEPTLDHPGDSGTSPDRAAEGAGPDGNIPSESPVLGEVVEGEPVPEPLPDDECFGAAETPGSASATVSNEPGDASSGMEIIRPLPSDFATPDDVMDSEIVAGVPADSSPGDGSADGSSQEERGHATVHDLEGTLDVVTGSALPGTAIVGAPIEGQPVGFDGPPPEEPQGSLPVRRRPPKRGIPPLIKIGVLGGAVLAAGLLGLWMGGVFDPPDPPLPPWDEIQRLVTEHKWTQATKKLDKFEKDFPEDPRLEQVPFFRDLCDAGPEIYSTTGQRARALEIMQKLFRDHRDNPAYKEYCGELYKGLAELLGQFVDMADKKADSRELAEARKAHAFLKQARDTHELYNTVGEAMTPEGMQQALTPEQVAKVGQTPPEAAELIAKTERSIRSRIAWLEIQALQARAQDRSKTVDLDTLYRELRQLAGIWLQEPESQLDQDEKYRKIIEGLRSQEYTRVEFKREEVDGAASGERDAGEDVGRQGNTLVVAWTKPGQAAVPANGTGDVVLALARGILYVFNPQGQLQWSRRLGVDSFRLPHVLRGSEWLTPALVAVSSEDQSLLALEIGREPGRVRWRYRAGQDIAAPLTVARLREDPNRPYRDFGFLPTAGGEVHVLELFRGRRIGRFVVGQPLTVGGVHWRPEQTGPQDTLRASGLVFFPADRERIFALDPSVLFAPSEPSGKSQASAKGDSGQVAPGPAAPAGGETPPACRYVLFTKHASGSLRGEPMVVGPYLVLSEATELDHTSLRVLQVRDQDYRDLTASGQHEAQLRGWAWFPPYRTPDRVTLVTDAGDLGVFGFNLDNPKENMYFVVQEQGMFPPQLSFQDASRTLVVYGEEHLVWVMAGGKLQLCAIDVIGQKVRPVWKEGHAGAVTGIPVHEAQVDRQSGTIYLTTMSPGGMSYRFSAVDAMSGKLRWQSQLGMSIQGDPLLWKGSILLLDQDGQKLTLRPSADPVFYDRPRMLPLVAADPLPEGMDENQVLRLGEPPDPVYLLATGEHGSKLAIRELRPPGTEKEDWSAQPWTVQPLPARETLCGRPCVLDGNLVVPCLYQAQGQVSLKMFPLGGGPPRADVRQYTWTPSYPPAMGKIDLYALGPGAILVVEGRRRLVRLELHTKDGVTQWDKGATEREPDGRVYHLRDALIDRPLVSGRELLAIDTQGRGYRLDVANPRRELAPPAPTGLSLSRAPLIRGEYLLAIDGDNRIVAYAPGRGSPLDGKPCWISEDPQRRRILGEPVLLDDTLLVADNSCQVSGIGLSDGKTRWKVPLKVHVGPAATAVPYGPHHLLVPLADGTVVVLPIPKEQPQAAETKK